MHKKVFALLTAIMLVSAAPGVCAADVTDGGFEVNPVSEGTCFTIGSPVCGINGTEELGDLAVGDRIGITLDGEWTDEEIPGMTAVCTLRDANNSVRAACAAPAAEGGGFRFTLQMTAPTALKYGEYTISTYLWEGALCQRIFTEGDTVCGAVSGELKQTAWTGLGGGFSISSRERYEGLSSLQISAGGEPSDEVMYTEAEAEPRRVQRLRFAAKGDTDFGYDVLSDGTSLLSGGAGRFEPSADWSFPSGAAFETDESGRVRIEFKNCGGAGRSYVDCVELTKNLVECEDFTLSRSKRSGMFRVVGDRLYTFSFDSLGDACTAYVKCGGKVIAYYDAATTGETAENTFDFYADDTQTELEYIIFSRGDAEVSNVYIGECSYDIIENGSFESSDYSPWYMRSTSTAEEPLQIINGYKGKGLMLTGREMYYTGIAQNISGGLSKFGLGKYKVSGYMRFDGTDAPQKISVRIQAQTANSSKGIPALQFGSTISDIGNEWQYFETVMDINSFGVDEAGNQLSALGSAKEDGIIKFETASGVLTDFCVDEIKLEAVDTGYEPPVYDEIEDESDMTDEPVTGDSFLQNGDFASGVTEPWAIRGKGGDETIELVEGALGSGDYGVKLSNRTYYYTGISQKIYESLNEHGLGKYKISGYVRLDGEGASGNVAIRVLTKRKPDKIYTAVILSDVGTEWKRFETEVDITSFGTDSGGAELTECSADGVLYIETAKGNLADLCIDEFKMYKAED